MLQVGWFTRRIKILRQLKSKFDMLGIQKIKERYSFQEIRHPAACGKQLGKNLNFQQKGTLTNLELCAKKCRQKWIS